MGITGKTGKVVHFGEGSREEGGDKKGRRVS